MINRYGSVPLLFSCKNEENYERTTISQHRGHKTKELRGVQQSEFQKCFQGWRKRWKKCIIVNGHCFETGQYQYRGINIYYPKKQLKIVRSSFKPLNLFKCLIIKEKNLPKQRNLRIKVLYLLTGRCRKFGNHRLTKNSRTLVINNPNSGSWIAIPSNSVHRQCATIRKDSWHSLHSVLPP